MSLECVSSDRQQPDPKEEGDEAIISMSVGGEVTDSSIMEVGRTRPQFQYSRKLLLEIKVLPLAKRRPDYLDSAYNNSRGVWDPERWHLNKKRSNTPVEEEQQRSATRNDQIPEAPASNKRRSGDPRERIRKEQDGIVLSPQRRSFNSGCFVNVTQPTARRPESPIGKPEASHRDPPVRRIGSGRLLNRDMWDDGWDAKSMFLKEKLEPERSEFAFRTSSAAATRDRDAREAVRDREPPPPPPPTIRENPRDRDDRSERYERRSFGRDFGDRGDQARERGGGGNDRNERGHPMDRCRDRRYSNEQRRRNYGEPEEPEWFSSGPTSQHDIIELRGFDDIPEEKSNNNIARSKKQSPGQKKRGKKATSEKEEKGQTGGGGGGGGGGDGSVVPKGRSTPTVMDQSMNAAHPPHSPISEKNEEETESGKERSETSGSAATEPSEINDRSDTAKSRDDDPPDFNLDDFLKSDIFPGVPGLLTNGVGAETGTGSRFSQWFKRDSPPIQQIDSRRASIQDELLNNLLNDITEPNIQIPSVTESNAYFAPISPANTTSNTDNPTTGVKLLEMLRRGNKPNQNGQGDATSTILPIMKKSVIKDMEVGGKVIHSLEELEARMRGGAPAASSNEPPRVNKTEEDLSAFKKLLAQVSGGQAVQAANGPISQKPPPMTLIQLLNNQLKAHQPSVPEPMPAPSFNHVGPLGPAQHPHQAQMQHENLMKVLRIQQQQQQQQQQKQRQQQQSDMLSMMMSGQQRMVGVSPVPQDMQMLVNNAPWNRELLQRPEALAIIQGLQQGEITRQHLIQQLQNPAMHHRHREVLINILKMYGGTTPRTVSPHADPILQQILHQQQQQQRIPSPMNNTFCSPPIIRPNLATSPNTLSVQHPVIPHRVPSPRGLVMNTQTIMQNALIKKKLEEQRENYRKRQEHLQHAKQPQLPSQQQQHHHHHQQQQQQQQQHHLHHHHHQMTSPVNSPSKQTLSPTPLAFTPTSVLRKMTAEKELDGSNESAKLAAQTQHAVEMTQLQSAVQLLAQGVLSRQKPAMGLQPSQPQAQVQVQGSWVSPPAKQHNGRPIVKGGNGSQFQYGRPVNFPQQAAPPQPQPPQRPSPGIYGNPAARSKHTMATPPMTHQNVPPYSIATNSIMNQRPNMMNNHMKAQQQQQQQQQVQSHLASMQHQQRASQVQLVMNHNNAARTDGRMLRSQQINIGVGRQGSPGSNGGSLSPTSNQLARWFSPELLAKARAGKLPELGQTNVLSLEELERLQYASTTVHN